MINMEKQKKIFGTDGIRGFANQGHMTPDYVLQVALAVGTLCHNGTHRHRVVIAKDTRVSGYMLEPALTSGFVSAGIDVVLVGPVPTPALALLTQSMRADIGVMLSASHNPYYDNGIKVFGADGRKISEEQENQIQQIIDKQAFRRVFKNDLGRAKRLEDAGGRYNEFVKRSLPQSLNLEGVKIVVDCANGASYKIAPMILYELGADVISLGIAPDGTNVNQQCGATNPEYMVQETLRHQADLGISLDGDADRVVMCDHKGTVIDGDKMLAILAIFWQSYKLLKGPVIGTHMSNLGLEHYLRENTIDFIRTYVGDKYISHAMKHYQSNLGGEASGHIILGDYSTTGDGILSALHILSIMQKEQKTLYDIAHLYQPMPQLLENIPNSHKNIMHNEAFQHIIKNAEKDIGNQARILVRQSGTEPLLRVMIEGDNERFIDDYMEILKQKIISFIGEIQDDI